MMIDIDRYTITLPLRDNNGRPVPDAHVSLRAGLRRHKNTAAWTESSVAGEWQGQRDDSIVYTIDVPANDPTAYDQLHAAAKRFAKRARQECVYLTREKRVQGELVEP